MDEPAVTRIQHLESNILSTSDSAENPPNLIIMQGKRQNEVSHFLLALKVVKFIIGTLQ